MFCNVIYDRLKWRSSSLTDQGRELGLPQVGLIIVAVFIVCHSLRWIPSMWELKQTGTDMVCIRFDYNVKDLNI